MGLFIILNLISPHRFENAVKNIPCLYVQKKKKKTMQHVDEVEVENISVKKIIH